MVLTLFLVGGFGYFVLSRSPDQIKWQPWSVAAVEKLRKLVADVRLPGKDQPLPFNAGLAEAVMRTAYDPVDIVTEVINRAEQALHDALAQGAGHVVSLAANMASAAVA